MILRINQNSAEHVIFIIIIFDGEIVIFTVIFLCRLDNVRHVAESCKIGFRILIIAYRRKKLVSLRVISRLQITKRALVLSAVGS